MERRATISDVAREAGVSIKTVSRVVRQEPNVADATRRRVQRAVERLGYRATQSARSASSKQSFLLGLLFDNPNPSYSADLIRASLVQAQAEGFHVVVEPVETDSRGLSLVVRNLVVQSNLAGLILPPPLCDREEVLAVLEQLGRPAARIAPAEPRTGMSVLTDDEAAARKMTEHLIGCGRRRVALVLGRAGTATTKRRRQGYVAALRAAGLPAQPDLIVEGDYTYRAGLAAGERLLSRRDRPDAVFALNDDMAAGVIAAAYKLGLSVPEDVAVAGFDDSVIATVVHPQLTTMRQPVARMAAAAVTALTHHLREDETPGEPTVIPCELMVRGSTVAGA